MELLIFSVLIALNSFFSLTEMSVVASNRTRLKQWAEAGRAGASAALQLASSPTRFLSVIQTGITAVGICSGVLGEGVFATPIRSWFEAFSWTQPYAAGLGLASAVVLLTVGQLLLGELIPKRVALLSPERFACFLAPVMNWLAKLIAPLVWSLEAITDGFLRCFKVKPSTEPTVTEEEIRVLVGQGAQAGVIEDEEHAMVNRVFSLDDQRVRAVMTPRAGIEYLDVAGPPEASLSLLQESPHSYLPICRGGLDEILGIGRATALIGSVLKHGKLVLGDDHDQPLYVPDSLSIMELLTTLKATGQCLAFVINEFGEVEGLVTLHDVLEALVGDIPSTANQQASDFVERVDGSWLADGAVSVGRMKEVTGIQQILPGEDEGVFHTLGGLVMARLGRLPREGDVHEEAGWRFEIADMDRHRVDKLILTPLLL